MAATAGTVVTPVYTGRVWRYAFTANGRTAYFQSRTQVTVYGQARSDWRGKGAVLTDESGGIIALALGTT